MFTPDISNTKVNYIRLHRLKVDIIVYVAVFEYLSNTFQMNSISILILSSLNFLEYLLIYYLLLFTVIYYFNTSACLRISLPGNRILV